MTDLLHSDNIGMHCSFQVNYIINYIIYYIIWAKLKLVIFYTYLIPALVFQSPQI